VHFKLVLDIDAPVRFTERIRKTRPQAAEAVFWDRLRRHAEHPENIPAAVYKIHQFLRKSFADNLHYELTERLKAHSDLEKPEVPRAIEALEIQIMEIQGGSLEILMFVLGFGKLAGLTGITADEFAKFLQVAAPPALAAIFGVPGLVRAQAMVAADAVEQSPTDNVGAANQFPATRPVLRYSRAAMLTALALGLGAWGLSGGRTGLVDEHQAFAGSAREDIVRNSAVWKPAELPQPAAKAEDKPNAPAGEMTHANTGSTSADTPEKATVQEATARAEQSPAPSGSACLLDVNLIRRVQFALNQQQLYFGYMDGMLGAWTRTGLSNFQGRSGLPTTGVPDTTTLEKLGIPCGSGQPL
jgi:Putative peptidoglycan binding domain